MFTNCLSTCAFLDVSSCLVVCFQLPTWMFLPLVPKSIYSVVKKQAMKIQQPGTSTWEAVLKPPYRGRYIVKELMGMWAKGVSKGSSVSDPMRLESFKQVQRDK